MPYQLLENYQIVSSETWRAEELLTSPGINVKDKFKSF